MIGLLFFKVLSQLQTILELKNLVLPFTHPADDEAVDQRAHNRTPADSDKRPHTEEEERKPDTDQTADDIINPLHRACRKPTPLPYLRYEELIRLRRDIGMEYHRNPQCTTQLADDEEHDPQHEVIRGDRGHKPHNQVEQITVHHRRDK